MMKDDNEDDLKNKEDLHIGKAHGAEHFPPLHDHPLTRAPQLLLEYRACSFIVKLSICALNYVKSI